MNIKKTLNPLQWSTSETSIHSLYTLSEKSLSTLIVYSSILGGVLYSELSYYILLWAGLVILISLIRLYYAYLYKKDPQKYSFRKWYKLFITLGFSTGIMVSFLGFGFIPYLDPYYQIFILAALLGQTAGATISLSSDFRIATVYISIIILPLIISTALQETPLRFILSVLLVIFYISQIMMILKSYAQEEKIKDLIQDNEKLLEENKQFIADMVHQIRTPLTVIMTNTSLIEMKHKLQDSLYIKQINSAINILSNSYEDLSYIISNHSITYKPIDINISDFLQERIVFFDVIAQVNQKNFVTDIDKDLWVHINDTELERIVDNNLSNAIKHGEDNCNIHISLKPDPSGIRLAFSTKGKPIKKTSMIFEKDYTENHSAKRSLGLGLHMVKNICEKNRIRYKAESHEGTNSFTYIFRHAEI